MTLEFSVTRRLDDFRQRQERSVGLRRRKILSEHLLQFLRIGIAQFEQKTDDVIAIRNLAIHRK